MVINIINASDWKVFSIGQSTCYSPNLDIIEKYRKNPESEFWLDTFTEFASVIVDKQVGKITLVRDHFGVEPLFYYISEDAVVFGSDLPDIIKFMRKTPELNTNLICERQLNLYFNSAKYTDETLYKNIYRLEPGCKLEIINERCTRSNFWQLDYNIDPIYYKHEEEYHEHFTDLLIEGIKLQTQCNNHVATEFSGGLDSSTVVSGLINSQIEPELYMHVVTKGSNEIDDSAYAQEVINQFQINKVHYIGAEQFELGEVIRRVATDFAGSPEFLFAIGASNIHTAVANSTHKILLSGFGGDECVSGHAPLQIYLRELCAIGKYEDALKELRLSIKTKSFLRRKLQFTRAKYPIIDKLIFETKSLPQKIKSFYYGTSDQSEYYFPCSIQEHEYNFLQGIYSHHLRFRVEESAVIARKLGFKYRYPLLYPKLVEFCHKLPLEFKRRNGSNRYMVRHYLAQYLPAKVYNKHQKIGSIMPATVHKLKHEYSNGNYAQLFSGLPFYEIANKLKKQFPEEHHRHLINHILLATLKEYNLR